jgi:O-antigen/teichoic acid export membrane protein
MSILKKLASETAVYGLSSILGRLIYYLLVTVHTKVFGPEDMAITITLFSYVAVLQVIFTYGMETTYFRYSNTEDRQKVYNQIFTAVLVVTMSLTLIIISFPAFFANLTGYPVEKFPNAPKYIVWMALVVAIDAAVAIPFARLRQEKQGKRFAMTKFINILINVVLNLLFLIVFKGIYEGQYLTGLQPFISKIYAPKSAIGYIFLANLIANFAMILMLKEFFIGIKPSFDKATMQKYWVYAMPILLVGLAGTLNGLTDRFVLESFLPAGFYPNRTAKQALGIYGNCIKLAIFMNLAVQAFKYAADPFFFSKAADKNAPQTFALVMKWFIIVCVLIWVGVSLNIDAFGAFFLKKAIYREGLVVVPVLLLANLFLGVYYNLSFWYKLTDKTQYGTYLTALGLAVTFIANIILIPKMGYLGCAWAFLLSTATMMVACYFLGEKHYPIPYDVKSALGYLAVGSFLILALNQIKLDGFWLDTLFNCFILGIFTAGIYVLEIKILRKKA